jgi:hypothetical protein
MRHFFVRQRTTRGPPADKAGRTPRRALELYPPSSGWAASVGIAIPKGTRPGLSTLEQKGLALLSLNNFYNN